MAQIEPPPNIIEKFNYIWKEWLNNLWQFIQDHTGGSSTGGTGTGSNWNAHGNIAVGNATTPLEINTGAFVITGTIGNTPTDIETAGTHFAWIPSKGAFRLGVTTGTQWADANIGTNSIAMGPDAEATGTNSLSIGQFTKSIANSIAIGPGCEANGSVDVSVGNSSVNNGNSCSVFGTQNLANASALFGVSIGHSTRVGPAVGFSSRPVAIGTFVRSEATAAVTIGSSNSGSEMINTTANSVWIGTGSAPTLILRNARAGILEQNPLSTLDVGGSVGFLYTNVAGSDGGTTNITGNEYTFRVDTSAMSGANTHTMQLPQLGASTIDRRVYYFKATNISATAHSATVTITPNAADQIEDFTTGIGQLFGAGVGLPITPGTAITIIANNSDGAWWVI